MRLAVDCEQPWYSGPTLIEAAEPSTGAYRLKTTKGKGRQVNGTILWRTEKRSLARLTSRLGGRVDLHVHSTFSDGSSHPEEIVVAAIRSEVGVLGFTDHFSPTPSPWLHPGYYLDTDGIGAYTECLAELKARHRKDIRILTGLETYALGAKALALPFEEFAGIDYLLFEDMHEDDECIGTLAQVRARLPHMAIGLAHFDFSMSEAEDMIPALEDVGIFVELNAAYADRYEEAGQFFRQVARSRVMISIGSDAHDLDMLGMVERAEDFVMRCSLQGNLASLLQHLAEGP